MPRSGTEPGATGSRVREAHGVGRRLQTISADRNTGRGYSADADTGREYYLATTSRPSTLLFFSLAH